MFISNIDPIAFSIGPISVRYYGLIFSSGFIIGYFIMQFFFRRAKKNPEILDKLLVYLFLGTIIGARLGHCLIYEPDFYLQNPIEILKIWRGGLASHGGIVGITLSLFIFCKLYKESFFNLADLLSIPTALVCSLIRLGNFTNSEILGKYTNSDFGVIFARLGENMPRYPAQLFESLAYFIIFILLFVMYFKHLEKIKGLILGSFIFLGFTARFLIEPFKIEQADYNLGIALNVGQILSIPFIILGIIIIIISIREAKKCHLK